jgi:hypothetical protein
MKAFQQLLKDKGYYNLAIDGIIGPKSLEGAHNFVLNELNKRSWVYPKNDIVFIRTDQVLDNKFSDYAVRFNNGKVDMIVPCSTTPGDFYVFNPLTVGGITGAAVACEQQVIGSHTFTTSANWKSLWLGAPYFMQTGAIKIFRDGNKDRNIDTAITTTGWYGINWHKGGLGTWVDNWSAGCMVVPDKHWFEMIKIFTNKQICNFTLFEI